MTPTPPAATVLTPEQIAEIRKWAKVLELPYSGIRQDFIRLRKSLPDFIASHEQLRRERDEAQAQAREAALRRAVEDLINLPDAHTAAELSRVYNAARAALATDAGQKVGEVVRAARNYRSATLRLRSMGGADVAAKMTDIHAAMEYMDGAMAETQATEEALFAAVEALGVSAADTQENADAADPWQLYDKSGCKCQMEDAAGYPTIVMYSSDCPIEKHRQQAAPADAGAVKAGDGWISAEEKPPPLDDYYRVKLGNGSIVNACWNESCRCWVEESGLTVLPGVIFWQPLPAAPEEKEKR